VEQLKTLKRIDKKIGKIKEKSGFVGQVCNIIENNKGNLILPDK
jgi:hypothetical protein